MVPFHRQALNSFNSDAKIHNFTLIKVDNSLLFLHFSTPSVPEVPSMLSRIFQHRAEAASTTSKLARSEASFTSTAEGSTETSTLFGQSEGSTSPLLVRFSQIRLSDLANRVEMKGKVELSRSRESLSDDFEEEREKEFSPTQWSRKSPSPRSHRRYELSSANAPVKLRKTSKCDIEKYKSGEYCSAFSNLMSLWRVLKGCTLLLFQNMRLFQW